MYIAIASKQAREHIKNEVILLKRFQDTLQPLQGMCASDEASAATYLLVPLDIMKMLNTAQAQFPHVRAVATTLLR